MRYQLVEKSASGHCCFKASILDTDAPVERRDGGIVDGQFRVVCECFELDAAKNILTQLNTKTASQQRADSEHEKNARIIIDSAMKLNSTVNLAMDLYLSLENPEPLLTDEQCRAIAVNYPYPWIDIRQWFRRN